MGAAVMALCKVMRDLYLPTDNARIMSKGLSGLGLLACLNATLGALLAELFGWQAALMTVPIFGGCTLTMIGLRFPETLRQKNPCALRSAMFGRLWMQIVRSPTFLAVLALSAASYAGLFIFLATSSFVFIKVLGLSWTQFGLMIFFMCFSYLLGTFSCRRLQVQFGQRKSVALAACLSLSGGIRMGAIAWAGISNVWAVMLPHLIYRVGHGIHQPYGQSGAGEPFRKTGIASALNGFLMMLVAFAMDGWLGTSKDGSVLPLTNSVWFWSIFIAFSAWALARKYGEPALAVNLQT